MQNKVIFKRLVTFIISLNNEVVWLIHKFIIYCLLSNISISLHPHIWRRDLELKYSIFVQIYFYNFNLFLQAKVNYYFKFWVSHNFVIPKISFSEHILKHTSALLKSSRVWLVFWPESVRNDLIATPMHTSLTSGCCATHYHYGVKFQKLWQSIYIIYIL